MYIFFVEWKNKIIFYHSAILIFIYYLCTLIGTIIQNEKDIYFICSNIGFCRL